MAKKRKITKPLKQSKVPTRAKPVAKAPAKPAADNTPISEINAAQHAFEDFALKLLRYLSGSLGTQEDAYDATPVIVALSQFLSISNPTGAASPSISIQNVLYLLENRLDHRVPGSQKWDLWQEMVDAAHDLRVEQFAGNVYGARRCTMELERKMFEWQQTVKAA